MDSNDERLFVDTNEAAKMLGLSAGYLRNVRIYNPEHSPPIARVGRRVLYPLTGPHGLKAWAERRAAAQYPILHAVT